MSSDFIRRLVSEDLEAGRATGIVTRFPPEPNGFLHIGHVKAIVLNFDIAAEHNGKCYLRFDDTNPAKEEQVYIDAIKTDVAWLGYEWEKITHASDYFAVLYADACRLIEMGKAYICELTAEQIRAYRGTLTTHGKDSPYRDRPPTESMRLFKEMHDGLHPEGKMVLRAKIDMRSPNICMRDPTIYRVKKLAHPRTGEQWQIYPMYDFTHCLSDAQENITHSLCTLEFQDNRALYDWFVQTLRPPPHPKQIEFARLSLSYTVTSKRRLASLIESGQVKDWDDPRLPTISGLRRRGYPAEALRNFCRRIGVSKKETVINYTVLEDEVRSVLHTQALRTMGVIDPLKVTITNFNASPFTITVPNHPQDASKGERTVRFAKTIYIERADFNASPPHKYFRLTPEQDVRLRYAFVIKCNEVVRDIDGQLSELLCTYDPATAKGQPPADGKKVKGIIHWIAEMDAHPAEVRLYDRLLQTPNWQDNSALNPTSLTVQNKSLIHRDFLAHKTPVQFERLGYFCHDHDSTDTKPVLNRIVTLRDTWAKVSGA